MLQLLRFTVFLILLLPVMVSGQEQKPMANPVDQTPVQTSQVQVSGVVTFLEPAWQNLVIQDGDQAVRVGLRSEFELPDSLMVGDAVRIDAYRKSSTDDRHVTAERIVRTGQGRLPEPQALNVEDALSLRNEDRFVECEGVVFRFDTDDEYGYLSISTQFAPLKLCVRLPDLAVVLRSEWLGRTVRVRGVLRFPQGEEREARILSSMPLLQRVPTSDSEIAAGGEFQLIKTLSGSGRDVTVPVNIIGQAISCSQSSHLIVQDHTWRVRVEASKPPEVRTGDIVVVRGLVRSDGDRLPVLSGEVELAGRGTPLDPVEVAVEEVASHPYQYIVTEGTLCGFRKTGDSRIPVLRDRETNFTISGPDDVLAVFDQVPVKSHFRVTGTCWPKTGKAYAFELLTSDVEIVYQPSDLPSVDRDASLTSNLLAASANGRVPYPGPIGPVTVAGVALLLMLVFLVAFLVVLRRTREQRKFYAAIHEQLNQVSHVSRLNTLAEMVGALAHEINQPLACVTNFAETGRILSKKTDGASPRLTDILEKISAESMRAGDIIRRLRTLVQKKTPGRVTVSINEIVQDSLDMFRMQELVASGLLDVRLQDDLPNIDVDPVQLQQVVVNFLLNARDATAQQEGRLPQIVVSTAYEDGMIVLAVEDNGPGIAAENASAIFEPYFTTKSEGLGLGLAISRTIIEMYDGRIDAENLDPHGTRLTVKLPTAGQAGQPVDRAVA